MTALFVEDSKLSSSTNPRKTEKIPAISSERLSVSQRCKRDGWALAGLGRDAGLPFPALAVFFVDADLLAEAVLLGAGDFPFAGLDFELDFLAGAAFFPALVFPPF